MLTIIKRTFVLSAVVAALFVYSGMKKPANNLALGLNKALQASVPDISILRAGVGDK